MGNTTTFPYADHIQAKIHPQLKSQPWMLSYFFKGMGEQQLLKVAKEYSLNHIDTILRSKVMEKIVWHKEQ
jgi:hypothetical protein